MWCFETCLLEENFLHALCLSCKYLYFCSQSRSYDKNMKVSEAWAQMCTKAIMILSKPGPHIIFKWNASPQEGGGDPLIYKATPNTGQLAGGGSPISNNNDYSCPPPLLLHDLKGPSADLWKHVSPWSAGGHFKSSREGKGLPLISVDSVPTCRSLEEW